MQISRDDLILIHCLHYDNILMVCFGVSARVIMALVFNNNNNNKFILIWRIKHTSLCALQRNC